MSFQNSDSWTTDFDISRRVEIILAENPLSPKRTPSFSSRCSMFSKCDWMGGACKGVHSYSRHGSEEEVDQPLRAKGDKVVQLLLDQEAVGKEMKAMKRRWKEAEEASWKAELGAGAARAGAKRSESPLIERKKVVNAPVVIVISDSESEEI